VRAAVMWEPGGPFDVREVDLREPGPGEVAVDIHACGLCASDMTLTTVFGIPTPVVLGHEGAGIVSAVGAGVSSPAVGDHVLIAWITPCGACAPCRRAQSHLCSRRRTSREGEGAGPSSPLSIDGTEVQQGMATATFAHRTVVPAIAAVALDPSVPFVVAAMMGCAVPTGVGAAIRSARVQPGDHVAVIGAGAIGMSAVLGARVGGATRIVSVDPSATRRERAVAIGSDEAVDPEELASMSPFDVVIDAVGRAETTTAAWRATRRGGSITVVGAGRPGQKIEIDAYELFHDEKRLVGCFAGGMTLARDLPVLVDLWSSGRLPIESLIDGTADLGRINEVAAAQGAGEVLRTILLPRG